MPRKILLADDSITIQKVISLALGSENYEILTADEGDDALKIVREQRPDLVMVDVGLPGMNGYEITDAIRKDLAIKNTPVILLAGTFEPLDAEEAERVGADDHLVKPFESRVLIDKVKSLLELYGKTVEEAAGAPRERARGAETWEEGNFLGFGEEFEKVEERPAVKAEERPEKEVPGEELPGFGFVEFNAHEAPQAPETRKPPAVPETKKPEEEWKTFDYGEPGEMPDLDKESYWWNIAPTTKEWKPEEDVGKFLEEEEKEEKEELKKPAEELLERFPDFSLPEPPAPVETGEKAVAGLEAAGEAAGIEEEPERAEEKIAVEEKAMEEAIEKAMEEKAMEEKAEPGPPVQGLQKEEVREIVERVAREVVREIAKDLVPDLAEKLVSEEVQRIREAIKGTK